MAISAEAIEQFQQPQMTVAEAAFAARNAERREGLIDADVRECIADVADSLHVAYQTRGSRDPGTAKPYYFTREYDENGKLVARPVRTADAAAILKYRRPADTKKPAAPTQNVISGAIESSTVEDVAVTRRARRLGGLSLKKTVGWAKDKVKNLQVRAQNYEFKGSRTEKVAAVSIAAGLVVAACVVTYRSGVVPGFRPDKFEPLSKFSGWGSGGSRTQASTEAISVRPRGGNNFFRMLENHDFTPTRPRSGGNNQSLHSIISERADEIRQVRGGRVWDRAHDLYGDQATNRLNRAITSLQMDGVDAKWEGRGDSAYITINGKSGTSEVWDTLSQELAKQQAADYLDGVSQAA